METSKETQRGLDAIRPLEQSEADGATKAAMSILKERAGIDRLVHYAHFSTVPRGFEIFREPPAGGHDG